MKYPLITSLDSEASAALDLDLNSASEEILASLSTLGPERARALVEARPFDYWTDLRRVPGFSASVIADLREAGARLDPAELHA